jgi:hypothetical protein
MTAKKRQAVLEAFSEPLTKGEEDFDEDDTEPESGDESYEAYQRWKKGKGKTSERVVGRFLERGLAANPVVMLISLKVSIWAQVFSKTNIRLTYNRAVLLGSTAPLQIMFS